VTLDGDRVRKPRALLWEWLVLGKDSPLRALLSRAAARDGLGRDAFDFLPSLAFASSDGSRGKTFLRKGGAVERAVLEPLRARSNDRKRALAEISGRAIALFSWLGVADLHWENLVLGQTDEERIVFGPLDVEIVLADLALPTETKLLPDPDPEYAEISRHACGLRRVLPYLGKPVPAELVVAMASAYVKTLALLERHAPEIADVLSRAPGFHDTPIRICLRGTGDYVRARTDPVWPPLLDAEREQLARGDIPYFFRLYGRPGIHWFADAALETTKTLPRRGDVPQLDPILNLSRSLRSPSRKSLREEGLFTVLGAFDHADVRGAFETAELSVAFGARTITARFADGEELTVRRNLRAFVADLYLPCRCGEVRTPFVPARTRCEAAARGRKEA
jgi:hypothetical protein